jgi:hypothetical protein
VIAEKYNKSRLHSPNNCKLMKHALFRAVMEDCVGMSPPKQGRKETILVALSVAISKQSAKMQVAGKGKASATKVIPLIEGLTANTA